MAPDTQQSTRRGRPATYAVFLALFAFVLMVSHLPLLSLPFYWDELGQFVPAALDLAREGAWVPHSTIPNVHPPAVMAYLAAVWKVAGFGIPVTRLAMLAVASAGVLFAFLLAIQLCREAPGRPALLAAGLLCVSPLFFAQAMLAQLDMPAMVLTTVALLLFLQERIPGAAAACVALVMVKETGLIVPAVFAVWLWREGRRREAALFLLPCAPLALWLAVLARGSGHLFGNQEFTRYNLFYPLHPLRLAAALARRLNYLFVSDFHWVGTLAVISCARRSRLFASRAWRVAGAMVAAHVAAFTIAGGAALERYLLPVLPIVYAAFAAALAYWSPWPRRAALTALLAGLAAGNFLNPPYAFPLENNLAFTDFVRLQQAASGFLERNCSGRTVFTTWPLSAALVRPEFGYVRRALKVRRLPDFTPGTVERAASQEDGLLVLYTTTWQPPWDLLGWAQGFRRKVYGYQPDITSLEVQAELPLELVARWERRHQWIEIYRRTSSFTGPSSPAGSGVRPSMSWGVKRSP